LLLSIGPFVSCTGEKPKPEWTNTRDILPQPNSQSKLTDQQVIRVQRIQTALSEADPSTTEKWIEDFEKDRDPEREILVWENITTAYEAYCSANRGLKVEAKEEVLKLLLARSETENESEILSHTSLNVLTPFQARDVMKYFHGSVAPIEVERK
jgi:hypothetical protein